MYHTSQTTFALLPAGFMPSQHLEFAIFKIGQAPSRQSLISHLSFLFHLLFVHHFEIPSSELALILCQQL